MGKKAWSLSVGLAIVMGLGGCDLLRSSPTEPVVGEEREDSAVDQVEAMIDAIEEERGRSFEPALTVVEGDPAAAPQEPPAAVMEELDAIEGLLFGDRRLSLRAADPEWAGLAKVDEGEIVFQGDPRVDTDALMGVGVALNEGLEEQVMGPLYEVETIDEWLTREVVRKAGPALMTALYGAMFLDVDLDKASLVERPELAMHLPGMGDRLSSLGGAPMDRAVTAQQEAPGIDGAVEGWVLRKALSLGATLYRAGEWTAVEWGRSEPPVQSEQVVNPGRWFEGEGETQWEWPEEMVQQMEEEGWTEVRRGRLGPGLASIWYSGLVGVDAARSIYGGWGGDHYRVMERDGQEAMLWTTAWQTPHDAQEVGAATEAALGYYQGADHRHQRFRVAVRGVQVAAVIYSDDQDADRLDAQVEALSEGRMGYLTREGAPFSFVPTLYDRYVELTEASTLDLETERWVDEAAGYEASLESLDGWTVQRANESHVRWFATHSDGTMVQWTTELVDPMGTEFGSTEYMESLGQRFAESVESPEEPELELIDRPQAETVSIATRGLIDGRPLELQVWQWRRGDVIVTFSLQGPESFFGDRYGEIRAILDSLEEYGDPLERRAEEDVVDPSEDEGILEFEVGE